jgi:hypothetical protein
MTPIKNNLAKVQLKKLPDGIETSFIAWENLSRNTTADQVLDQQIVAELNPVRIGCNDALPWQRFRFVR